MRFLIPILAAFLLSFTLSGQEYKKVYTEMTDDKLGQILEEENLAYDDPDHPGYFLEFKRDGSADITVLISVNQYDNIKIFTPCDKEVEVKSYILHEFNREHPEMLAYNNKEAGLVIKSTVRCTGGIPRRHVVERIYLFAKKVMNFNDKYMAK